MNNDGRFYVFSDAVATLSEMFVELEDEYNLDSDSITVQELLDQVNKLIDFIKLNDQK